MGENLVDDDVESHWKHASRATTEDTTARIGGDLA